MSDPRATLRRMFPDAPDAAGSSTSRGAAPDSSVCSVDGGPLAALTLDQWRSFEPAAARRVAREAADLVGGRLVGVEAVEHLGGPSHRVRIERDGQEFALIPGGRVTLGFDARTWRPTAEQTADYAVSREQGFEYGTDLREHLVRVLSPRRTVVLPTVLMAVEGEQLTEAPADMPAVLAERGLRMPTSDEWEHACGAGAGTVFRWGDDCPLDRIPYGDLTGPHNEPNAFGLRIAHDTYSTELTSDTSEVRGGDGGESVCGGYGHLLAWLPLATAHTHPDTAEFVYGEDGDGLYEDFTVRPVLTLRRA